MDDQNVANWVGGAAIGLMLAAVAWVLVSPSSGTSGGNDPVPVSDRQASGTGFAIHRPLHQGQRCIAAGCMAPRYAPSAPPTSSDRRVQGSNSPGAVGVMPPPAQVSAPAAPTSQPPPTQQPSTSPPSTPPPGPTQQRLPHHGPVPGGNTTPPQTGPRP